MGKKDLRVLKRSEKNKKKYEDFKALGQDLPKLETDSNLEENINAPLKAEYDRRISSIFELEQQINNNARKIQSLSEKLGKKSPSSQNPSNTIIDRSCLSLSNEITRQVLDETRINQSKLGKRQGQVDRLQMTRDILKKQNEELVQKLPMLNAAHIKLDDQLRKQNEIIRNLRSELKQKPEKGFPKSKSSKKPRCPQKTRGNKTLDQNTNTNANDAFEIDNSFAALSLMDDGTNSYLPSFTNGKKKKQGCFVDDDVAILLYERPGF